MAGEVVATIVGNLTADPEIRFTPSGVAVASFTVASTPRAYSRSSGQWEDGTTLFMRCTVWRDAAENISESLGRGARVIVQGRLVQRSFTARDGSERTVVEMQADEVGPSLRYARAQVTRLRRGGQAAQQGAPQATAQQPGAFAQALSGQVAPQPPPEQDQQLPYGEPPF